MTGLKVVLFISFLFTAVFGLLGLFAPATMANMGMGPADGLYTRIFSTAVIAFSLLMWYTFRNPLKNIVVVRGVITWFGLEAIVLIVSAGGGAMPWANAIPGIIFDGVLAILLAVFYPRARAETQAAPATSPAR